MTFTAADLRQIVGRAVFERGLQFFELGSVDDLSIGSDSVTGVVYGGDVFDVTIDNPDTIPTFYCPCGYRSKPACKHVVGVWLAWEAAVSRDQEPEGTHALSVDASESEVEEWAEQYHLADLLDRPFDILGPSIKRLAHAQTVREVLTEPRGASERAARLFALQLLDEEAEYREAGRTFESARMDQRKAPDLAALQTSWNALMKLRSTIRPQTHPIWQGALCGVSLTLEPPTLVLSTDRPRWACGGARDATVRFDDDGRSVWVRCGCPEPNSRCAVALAAIDGALDFLEGLSPEWSEERNDLAETLRIPEWERFLTSVDQVIAAPTEAIVVKGKAAKLGWTVTSVGMVEPILYRTRKGGGEFITSRPSTNQRDRLHALCETRAERQVVDLLVGVRHRVLSVGIRARALMALSHRAAVFDREMQPLTVVATRIEMHVEHSDGATDPQFTFYLGDIPRTPEQLLEWGRAGETHIIRVDDEAGKCYVAELPPRLMGLARLLFERGRALPPKAVSGLLNRLSDPKISFVGLQLSPKLRGGEVPSDAKPHVRLSLDGRGGLDVRLRVRPIPERGLVKPGDGTELLFGIRNGQRVFSSRDFSAELDQAKAVMTGSGLDAIEPLERWRWRFDDMQSALALVSALKTYGGPCVTEWDAEGRLEVGAEITANELDIGVKRKRDWFSIKGTAKAGNDLIPLSEVLSVIRDRKRFIQLDDERWVGIDEKLRQDLMQVASLVNRAGDMPILGAPILAMVADSGVEIEGDEWRDMSANLAEAADLQIEPPPNLNAELRAYQADGYRWIRRLAHWSTGAVLADDMGLGKTIQALALLLHRAPNGPALVIAPTSVGINWQREAARFAPSLRIVLFRGSKALAGLDGLGPSDVVVTSYDLVVRNLDRLKAIPFDTLVLDEAQAIKNPTTRRARAVFALDRRFTLALTGTPVENRASELWSLFRAVAPGYLGSVDHFREQFIRPLETGDEDARRALAGSVRPFILRRLKSEVARDLPPRSDVRIDVELSEKERALYEQLRKSVVAELDPQNKVESVEPRDRRFQVLAALTHLRRLASDPRLVYPETRVVSSKLTVLRSLLSELRAEGHRALVFSQFTSLLAHVREILDGESVPYEYLDGSTSVKKRMAAVDAFQAGRSDLFLLSVKAGGTGLNLTAADYVIHLDPWWNPAIEDQATDRAHRIGQTNPVTVYRMVALGTVEETIYDLHHTKRELVAALLAGTDSTAPLKTEDLMGLLTAHT